MLRQVKAWHLVVLLVALLGMSAFFLRQNNLHMIERRNLVLQADEQNGDIAKAMTELRNYIGTHMNTGMEDRGIYLEHSYQRAYEAAVAQASQTGNYTAIYQLADRECQAAYDRTTAFAAYVQCVTDKVIAAGATPDPQMPSADLYRFDFVSPAWSPDVAGFTLLTTVLVTIIVIGRWALLGVMYTLVNARR
jgi:hypothetical protein